MDRGEEEQVTILSRILNLGVRVRTLGLAATLLLRQGQSRGGLVRVRLHGLAYPITLRSNGVDVAILEEVFGQRQYQHRLLDLLDPRVVVDAGAHIGVASVYFATRFPRAQVIAIEPDPANFGLLQTNTKAYSNIQAWNAAVWPKVEPLAISNPGGQSWGFRVGADPLGSTRAVTLTQIVEQFGGIDLLKLDVEGAEKALFESGYESWLPRTRALCIELHDRLVPGCARAVYSALVGYPFERAQHHGEIDIVVLQAKADSPVTS